MGCRPFHGLACSFYIDPGACAPGFMLSPASQAKTLNSDSERTKVAQLTMYGNANRASSNRQVIRQAENDLDEWEVRHGPHVFSRYVVGLVITVDQINNHCGARIALDQRQT